MMLLTKYNPLWLIRISAIMSILIGALYLPAIWHYSIPIHGLGPDLAEGQQAVEKWARWSIFGGLSLLAVSFLYKPAATPIINRLLLSLLLASLFMLMLGQLLPLFWYLYVGLAVFSWSSIISFLLHSIIGVFALWSSLVTLHTLHKQSR